jgi:Zn-finger nucleic acid-binding protein
MDKTVVGAERTRLDHCRRCGGVWFQLGEVQQVRRETADLLWNRIPKRESIVRAACHSCHTLYDRTQDRCPACGSVATFRCPECDRRMERVQRGEHAFDVCRKCKGVWFDHHEIAAIWTIGLATSLANRPVATAGVPENEHGSSLLLDAFLFAPDLAFVPVHIAGTVASAAIEAAGHAPETIGVAVEVVGDAAGSVFGAIVEIIAGIFSLGS